MNTRAMAIAMTITKIVNYNDKDDSGNNSDDDDDNGDNDDDDDNNDGNHWCFYNI